MPSSLPCRRPVHRLVAIALAVALLVSGVGRVGATTPFDATPVTGGAFFERAHADGLGFAIRNYADGPSLYDAFLRFGGAQTLGPPVSRPWVDDGGFVYQVTQRALLQWSPADNRVAMANLFELLNGAEFADELQARHIPAAETPPSLPPELAQQARLAWLTDRAIAETFANNPLDLGNLDASLEFHGLPMSRPVRLGPFVVQRFQRTALQHWLEQVEDGPPVGSVVLVNAGDVFRDLALPDDLLATPHASDHAAVLDVRLDPPANADLQPAPVASGIYNTQNHRLRTALALLEGVEANATALELAASTQLAIGFEELPESVLASYHASRGIRVNATLRSEDPRPLAAVLAHELQHFEDFMLGRLAEDSQGCLDAEARALAREVETWRALLDAGGVPPRPSVLVRIEESRAAVSTDDSKGVEHLVQRLYRDACDKARIESAKG